MSIPIKIKNLFYLLTYAWELNEEDWISNNRSALNVDKVDGALNLLATILKISINRLIRRGLDRSYKDISEEIPGVRGRIDIGQTIKRNGFANLKLTCNFEELRHSVLHNQIIKTTLTNLIKTKELDKNLKEEIVNINSKLSEIETIILNQNIFSKVRFHSNIKNYRVPIYLCNLIYNQLLPNTETGKYDFYNIKEEELSKIFEKFVLKFYQKHLQDGKARVKSDKADWQNIDWLETKEENRNLPQLLTDVSIYNEKTKSKLIIDAKFYKSSVARTQTRFLSIKNEKEKIINIDNENSKYKFKRDHIFQLFAYLKNFEIKEKKERKTDIKMNGMLLYALSDVPLSTTFMMHGHKVKIQTIDLNKEPEDIKNQMFEQIKTFDEISINA